MAPREDYDTPSPRPILRNPNKPKVRHVNRYKKNDENVDANQDATSPKTSPIQEEVEGGSEYSTP
jgi:hypothetical protein